MREFIYRINQTDQIYFVNRDWLDFGDENGLTSPLDNVIGSRLWTHICDLTTRQLYYDIIQRVRRTGQAIKVPFRCDGPTVRRFMELEISTMPGANVELKGVLIRQEPRPAVDLLDSSSERGGEILEMCAWCKRIKVSEWMEVEEAVHALGLFERSALPLISHVTCPDCQARNSGELE